MAISPRIRYFDNGMQLVTVAGASHLAMIGIGAGSVDDPDDFEGAAHTMEHLFIRGASDEVIEMNLDRKPPFVSERELNRIMCRYLGGTDGSGMNVYTAHGYTVYAHGDLRNRSYLKRVFGAFAATVRDGMYDLRNSDGHGILEDPALSIERPVVGNETGLNNDDSATIVMKAISKKLYGGHPVARWGDSNRKQLAKATLRQLKAWGRQYYVPSNMRIVMIGPKQREAVTLVQKAGLDQIPNWPMTGVHPGPLVPRLGDIRRQTIKRRGVEMTHVSLLWPTEVFETDDSNALTVLSEVMKDRIEDELREGNRRYPGGVYHLSVMWSASSQHGCLSVCFATEAGPKHAQELIERTIQVCVDLHDNKSTAFTQAVEDKKRYQVDCFRSAGSLGNQIMESLMYGDPELKRFVQFPQRMMSLTPQDVRRAARKYLHRDRFVQVILQPAK